MDSKSCARPKSVCARCPAGPVLAASFSKFVGQWRKNAASAEHCIMLNRISACWCLLNTVHVETSYHSGNLSTTLFGVLFEGMCFKFFYEFFYGVFKVGLNTQQNSPATHSSAIQNSITKLNLNSAEIALSKPVSVFSEC